MIDIIVFLPLIIFLLQEYISKYINNDIIDVLSMFFVSGAIISFHQNNLSMCLILYMSFYSLQSISISSPKNNIDISSSCACKYSINEEQNESQEEEEGHEDKQIIIEEKEEQENFTENEKKMVPALIGFRDTSLNFSKFHV